MLQCCTRGCCRTSFTTAPHPTPPPDAEPILSVGRSSGSARRRRASSGLGARHGLVSSTSGLARVAHLSAAADLVDRGDLLGVGSAGRTLVLVLILVEHLDVLEA